MTTKNPQAVLLYALADHLDAHPELAMVNINRAGGRTDLQIVGSFGTDTTLDDLRAWAASIGADTLEVKLTDNTFGEAHLHARGTIAGLPVEVWDALPGAYEVGQEIPVDTASAAA